jgi:hypothetical protein
MADMKEAVQVVRDQMKFHTERVKALDGVLAELMQLRGATATNGTATASDIPRRPRRRMSAAAKKAISIRMRKHWAEKRKAEK